MHESYIDEIKAKLDKLQIERPHLKEIQLIKMKKYIDWAKAHPEYLKAGFILEEKDHIVIGLKLEKT